MLADDICTEGYYCASTDQVFRRAGETIARAARFRVDKEVLFAASFISSTMPSSLVRGLPLCRLPYPDTWFEYCGADLARALDRDNEAPHRIGLLCESQPSTPLELTVSLFWQHKRKDAKPELSPFSMAIDLRPELDISASLKSGSPTPAAPVDVLRKQLLASNQPRDRAIGQDIDEVHATFSLRKRVLFNLSRYGDLAKPPSKYLSGWLNNKQRSGGMAEAGLFLGILMLINTRNGTRQEPCDLGKLNAARAKRRSFPLLDYSTITLHLDRHSREFPRAGDSHADLEAHLVRGHFKVRRTGIFWWSPHVRGTLADVPGVRTYHVKR